MDVIKAWQEILSPENVFTEESNLTAVQTGTFATKQRILAIIRPGDRTEVQECVKIANQYQTPIYPISCGKNWGLGSRVPVADNCVVMDLGRLNQIIDYNEKFAYITVEPGVTFQQVYEYLLDIKSNLFLSVIGGSPHASLIGNALERGDGIGPNGDRVKSICAFEVVLPTGEVIHTGFGRFTHAKTTSLSPWGVGPSLDGIFTQSNLGIVTQMTVWLTPIPKYYQSFSCLIKDHHSLEKVIDIIQQLMLQGVIQENCFNFWNCYKVLAREGRYPWQMLGGKTPLSLQELKGVEPWVATGDLYCTSQEQAISLQKIIEAALTEDIAQIVFTHQEHNEPFNLTLGVPSDINTKSTYWRKKIKVPNHIDPDRDACGVIWLCPLFPFDGQQLVTALNTIESIIKSSGFEPNIAINCSTSRSIKMFIAIMYDRLELGQDQKAMECHNQLLEFLMNSGYIPYRLGIQSMSCLSTSDDNYNQLLKNIKQELDPNNILAPGRYQAS
ncbi:FAD-binding oxidoreductase [Cuspidothrix issatschenkoi LEGE 03284]|uniref:FAD-binding oxidoreductase n=1 Tax=Cuspidothrix issatschenkoi TaxID=230752 RepID=UPI001882A29F|nr:FAD-binding oxidoreductase [Cuspidothrix issatschenkoi]MBE9234127.1 FAD-binding oxidoreductase [Cuspidothrix issatschenkoi LEGE 03284]